MRNKKGFTLLEVLVVVTIVAILVLLAVPNVQRSIFHSRTRSFVKDARTVVSATKSDTISTDAKPTEDYGDIVVYKMDDINGILDKQLDDSPFGSKYKAASVVIKKTTDAQGVVKYTKYICLVDKDGNGFDFTESSKITANTIKQNMKDVTCESDYSLFDVEVVVVGGTALFTSQSVLNGEKAEFDLVLANGYNETNPIVSCTNGQTATLSNMKLTTGEVTSDTVCTVTFRKNAYYTVTINSVKGTVSGNSSRKVLHAGTTSFTVYPDLEYLYDNVSCTNGQTASYSGSILTTGEITSDTTCTIVFKAKLYNIAYELNGGTATNPTSYTIETNTFTLNNPTRTGYDFLGWSGSNGSSAERTVTIAKGSSGDKHYIANWTPTTYNINYNLNGGTVSSTNPSSYNIETSTFTLNNPTRSGYTFTGWTGTGLSAATKTVTIAKGSTGNRTYTATWVGNNVNITYYSGNLVEGIAAKSEQNASTGMIKYSVNSNGVVRVTSIGSSTTNDYYGFIDGISVYLEQGKEYVFSMSSTGKWGPGSLGDTVEAFLMYSSDASKWHRLAEHTANTTYPAGPNSTTFTATQTGTYWLRLDVNKTNTTYEFSNIEVYQKVRKDAKKYNEKYGSAPSISRTGYSLDGWYTAKSGGSKIESTTTITKNEDHNLYTHWSKNIVTLTCPSSPADKQYTGTSQSSGITCPAGSTAGGTQSATDRGTYTQTCTANNGYKFTSACNVTWRIKCNTTISGTKAVGQTVTYAGKSWTVVSISGSNINLAYNGVYGSGTYYGATSAVNTFLDANAISKDARAASCIDNNGSSSNTTTNAPAAYHWTYSGSVYVPEQVTAYNLTSKNYCFGMKKTSDYSELCKYSYPTVSTPYTLYAAGSIASLNDANTALSLPNTVQTSSLTSDYFSTGGSRRYAMWTSQCGTRASSATMPIHKQGWDRDGNSLNSTSTTCPVPQTDGVVEERFGNTKELIINICGSAGNNGSSVKFKAKNDTQYTYTNIEGTSGTYNYADTDDYWTFAGAAVSTTTESSPSYIRTYNYNNESCSQRTVYSVSDSSATVYYRPYITVKNYN